MHFEHSSEIWRDFPNLVPGVVSVEGITPDVSVDDAVARYVAAKLSRRSSSDQSIIARGGAKSAFPRPRRAGCSRW
jgi:hypothetical protein